MVTSVSAEISDRTTRFVRTYLNSGGRDSSELFASRKLSIAGNEALLREYNGQVMVLALVNLLSRFHPHITSTLPSGITNHVWVPFGAENDLSSCMEGIAEGIGSCVDRVDDRQRADVLVSVGETDTEADHKITINSDGWLSSIATNDNKLDFVSKNENAIGALSAACFGAAEAFRRVLQSLGSTDRRIRQKYQELVFSALDYSVNNPEAPNPRLPVKIDIESLLMVGVGAVANGLILALNTISGLHGTVTVIDPQVYEASNINRCVMASRNDIGTPKTAVLASGYNSRIRVIPSQNRYESFRRTSGKLDMVVETIDENEPRVTIQSDLPKILLHGATGDEIATISRHNFIDDACLGCIFSESASIADSIAWETGLPPEEVTFLLESNSPITAEQVARIAEKTGISLSRLQSFVGLPLTELYTREICGVVKIEVQQREIAATVSFVSALPGILLAGEVIKERVGEFGAYCLNNYLTLSLFNPSSRWLLVRPKDERCKCLCSHPIMQERYVEKWLRQK
jgi:molybdopterin/thiamine biosynthesis adenylyltransferase